MRPRTDCLSPGQAAAVTAVFYPDYTVNGTLVSPGFDLGSEAQWSTYFGDASLLSGFDVAYERYFLGHPIRVQDYTDDIVAPVGARANPGLSTAGPVDLSAFRTRAKAVARRAGVGGKLLLYHGLADGLLPRKNSLRYYRETARRHEQQHRRPAHLVPLLRGARHAALLLPGHGPRGLGPSPAPARPPSCACCLTSAAACQRRCRPWATGGPSPGHLGDANYDALVALMRWSRRACPSTSSWPPAPTRPGPTTPSAPSAPTPRSRPSWAAPTCTTRAGGVSVVCLFYQLIHTSTPLRKRRFVSVEFGVGIPQVGIGNLGMGKGNFTGLIILIMYMYVVLLYELLK